MLKRGTPNSFALRADTLCETGILAANTLTLVLPLVLVQLFDRVIPNNATETLTVLALALLVALVLEAVLRAAVGRLMAASAEKYETEAQEKLITSVLDAKGVEKRHTPSSLQEAFETIERVRASHAANTRHTRFDIPFAGLFLLAFWYVAPPLSIAMLAVLAVTYGGNALTRRLSLKHAEKLRDQRKRSLSLSTETLGSIEHLKGLRAEPFMQRRMESLLSNSAETTERLVLTNAIGKTLNEVAAQATPVVIAVFGAVAAINGTISTGALAAAILLSGRIVQPFLRQQQHDDQQRLLTPYIASLDALLADMDMSDIDTSLQDVKRIDLRDVCFEDADGHAILDSVSLSVQAGETIVLTGNSGSGKSLLLKLMFGELMPTSGRIKINNIPLHEISHDDVGQCIGVMSQNPEFPTGTALDVMTGFAGKRKIADALPIIEELGLSGFFASNPEGFMVKVGGAVSRGLPSSMQACLPIVATFARKPDVLLFDEANGPLDRESDTRLMHALQKRKGQMTMIIVTQRPSYASLADRIYALEEGRLIETNMAGFKRRITGDLAA